MAYRQTGSKTLLQRRSSLSNMIQQLLDGAAVIGLSWFHITRHMGGLYSPYVNFILVLIVVMALTYDKFAIYRSNGHSIDKALNLLKAWTLTFLVLVVLAFLTKVSSVYSRNLILQLYVMGYIVQLIMHVLFRIIYKQIILHSQQNEKVLIVGLSRLAYYLQHKISDNPWVGEQVVGFVRLPNDNEIASGRKAAGRKNDPEILGNIEDLPSLIDQHDISMVYIVTPLKSSKALEDIYMSVKMCIRDRD